MPTLSPTDSDTPPMSWPSVTLASATTLEILETLSYRVASQVQDNIVSQNELKTSREEVQKLSENIHLLKSDNSALRKEIDRLREELGDLRTTLNEANNFIDELSTHRKPFIQPPPEILRLIFSRAIPPSFLLDPNLSNGPESGWCKTLRTKKSIVGVCRLWHRIGVEILYEDIAIRRIGQLSALLNTLERNNDQYLSQFIKSLAIVSFTPKGYESLFFAQVQELFGRCPRLDYLNYSPLHGAPLPSVPFSLTLTKNITRLEIGSVVRFSTAIALLKETHPRIVTLALFLNAYPLMAEGVPHFDFEHLTTLRLGIHTNCSQNLHILATNWTMPQLKHLTLAQSGNGEDSTPAATHYKTFCDIHGKHLRYLHFQPSYWCRMDYIFVFQPILDACPELEHLILHPNAVTPLTHATVKWLDIWERYPAQLSAEEEKFASLRRSFPALRQLRKIASALALRTDIPLMLPPWAITGDLDVLEFYQPGVEVKQGRRSIDWGELLSDEDSSDDPSYVGETGELDYSGSETSSSSEGSPSEEEQEVDTWEVTLQSTLDIFSQIVEES